MFLWTATPQRIILISKLLKIKNFDYVMETCETCLSLNTCKSCEHCNYTVCKSCYNKYFECDLKKTLQCFNCQTMSTQLNSLLSKKLYDYLLKQTLFQNELLKYSCDDVFIHKRQYETKHKLKSLLKKQKMLKKELNDNKKVITILKNKLNNPSVLLNNQFSITTELQKCPVENCNGYFHNSYCESCNQHICEHCFEPVLNDSHKCDAQKKSSISMIKNNSKPCPTCGHYITKISGCDQMWCTQCKTSFNWTTNIAIKSNFHNPHYNEWFLNEIKIQFFQLPSYNDFHIVFNKYNHIYDFHSGFILKFFNLRLSLFLLFDKLYHYGYLFKKQNCNQYLRNDFFLNMIQEKKFKSVLKRRYMSVQRLCLLFDIYHSFFNHIIPIIHSFFLKQKYKPDLIHFHNDMLKFILQFNSNMFDHYLKYNSNSFNLSFDLNTFELVKIKNVKKV